MDPPPAQENFRALEWIGAARLCVCRVMDLIEIPLQHFVYRFRPLTWREEIRLKFPPNEDQRKVVFATALSDVSGLKIKPAEAKTILAQLPEALIWRIRILYRGKCPPDRYYTSTVLYEAPDGANRESPPRHKGDEPRDTGSWPNEAHRQEQESEIGRQLFEQARKAGKLVPATEAGSNA